MGRLGRAGSLQKRIWQRLERPGEETDWLEVPDAVPGCDGSVASERGFWGQARQAFLPA